MGSSILGCPAPLLLSEYITIKVVGTVWMRTIAHSAVKIETLGEPAFKGLPLHKIGHHNPVGSIVAVAVLPGGIITGTAPALPAYVAIKLCL